LQSSIEGHLVENSFSEQVISFASLVLIKFLQTCSQKICNAGSWNNVAHSTACQHVNCGSSGWCEAMHECSLPGLTNIV